MPGIKPPVGQLVEHHAKSFQPGNRKRCIMRKGRDQVGLIGEVTAADCVHIVIER